MTDGVMDAPFVYKCVCECVVCIIDLLIINKVNHILDILNIYFLYQMIPEETEWVTFDVEIIFC